MSRSFWFSLGVHVSFLAVIALLGWKTETIQLQQNQQVTVKLMEKTTPSPPPSTPVSKPQPVETLKPVATPKPKEKVVPKKTPVPRPDPTPAPTPRPTATAKPTARPTPIPSPTPLQSQFTAEELKKLREKKGIETEDAKELYEDRKSPSDRQSDPKPNSAQQRAKSKVKNTSASWDQLGLPDYYARNALTKVSRLFRVPPADQSDAEATVLVRIARDGTLSNIRIGKSSGSTKLDEYALSAVKATAKFSPLPDSFPKDSANVEISFSFQQ